MEKKKRGGVMGTAAVAGVALLLAGGFGFGNGAGFGQGEALPAVSDQVVEQDENTMENEKAEQTQATVIIEVKQSEYFIDGQKVALEEVEELIKQSQGTNTVFMLEDNYASAKAWDDITALFLSYEIGVVE